MGDYFNYMEMMGSSSDSGSFLVGIMRMMTLFNYIAIAFGVVSIVCIVVLFEKHYNEKGWKGLVPFLNMYIISEKSYGKGKGWMSFLLLIPIFNFVYMFIFFHKMSTKLGWGVGMTLMLVFVPVIGYPLLAFSKNTKYVE